MLANQELLHIATAAHTELPISILLLLLFTHHQLQRAVCAAGS
jgi:hypothetical protein